MQEFACNSWFKTEFQKLLFCLDPAGVEDHRLLVWQVDGQLLDRGAHLVERELKQSPERICITIPRRIYVVGDLIYLS